MKDNLSLRDYFAGLAMQVLMKKYGGKMDISEKAYAYADAMLAQRDK
jgi:hypothetical protein